MKLNAVSVVFACVSTALAIGPVSADSLRMPAPSLKHATIVEMAPIWTGAYAGLNGGYATGDSDAQEINGPRNFIADFDGAIGSAHIGWQKQSGRLVGGVEFEAGYLGTGSSITRDVTGGHVTSGASRRLRRLVWPPRLSRTAQFACIRPRRYRRGGFGR